MDNAFDVNQDGLADVIFDCDNGAYLVFGTANFINLTYAIEFAPALAPGVAGVGDFNGDGNSDVMVSDSVGPGNLSDLW